MIYRTPSREERTTINRALDRWGAFEFLNEKVLKVRNDGNGKIVVCLITDMMEKVMQLHQSYSSGLLLGHLKKQFVPTIAGADLFARYGSRNRFYIVVNDRAEKLVLYGRDIMGDSIVEACDTLGENELVIVLNSSDDTIAIGRTRFAGRLLFQKSRVTVSTVDDAGYYLREEG